MTVGNVAENASQGNELLAKRDRLMVNLRATVSGGLWGVGLTRDGGSEHLLVLADPSIAHLIPADFEGVLVTLRSTAKAKAQLA